MARTLALSLLTLPLVFAAQAPTFKAPSEGPLIPSPNFGGPSNGSLSKQPVQTGLMFDRFIQIWLENTDFATANSSPTFQSLAKQGVLLTGYYALTHPSEPNYVASVGGDFFGMHDDNLYNIPANVSTIVDLLEGKNISWASYQETMATDGSLDFSEDAPDYVDGTGTYTYYVRKHNPLIVFDSVAGNTRRRNLQRTFNDFAADVNASAIPQWLFVTPNLVDDAHDTTIEYASQWLEFWLLPLLKDERFNDNRTLILLTFDENETGSVNNQILSILLGGAVPEAARGTADDTYYTHYSSLSTVQANWGLGCLGRGDTDPKMANVYDLVAKAIGHDGNNDLTGSSDLPLTNLSGPIPGPLNEAVYVPFTAQNANATCANKAGKVFVAPGVDLSLTADKAPAAVNLTALNENVPAAGNINLSATATAPGSSPTSPGSSGPSPTSGAAHTMVNLAVAIIVATFIGLTL
ncbi:hypothetical protein Clacol_005892 [Clathrus columnatus]|uniref:Acid phosphatase n=1 Tax=Clathrus columnatus TaxID=1419009 RepID=A0AAV5AAJ9_9AGAM|nr:hypothetical protein Clacol_005892 [Clathrus columnatus]